MKNKKLLFIGVLAAFLMLAVPFAVVSVDTESADAGESISPINVGDTEILKTALEGEGNAYLKLTANLVIPSQEGVFSTISCAGEKVLDLNGHSIVDNSKRLIEVTVPNVHVKIIGNDGSITANRLIKTVYQGADAVTIIGGTYVTEYTAILTYGSGTNANVINVSGANFTVNNEAAIWVSNDSPNIVNVENTEIYSDELGIFCGVVEKVTFDEVTINSASTALEIKSGKIQILDSKLTSAGYSTDGEVEQANGSGYPVSTVFMNNAYAEILNQNEVSLVIDDKSVLSNSLSNYTVLISAPDPAEMYISWKNVDTNVQILEGSEKVTRTSNKPIDSETTDIESESNDIKFDIDGTKTLNDELSVELGVVDTKFLYVITLPSGTEMSEGASITVDEVASGVYDIDFENIDTNGGIIYVTLPFYGKPSDVPIVYYLDDVTGEQIPMDTELSPDGKSAIFTTTHNSKYIVGVKDSSSGSAGFIMGDSGIDSNIIYIAEIVLIVLALAGLVAVIRRN